MFGQISFQSVGDDARAKDYVVNGMDLLARVQKWLNVDSLRIDGDALKCFRSILQPRALNFSHVIAVRRKLCSAECERRNWPPDPQATKPLTPPDYQRVERDIRARYYG